MKSDSDNGHTAGVTGQLGMLTPPYPTSIFFKIPLTNIKQCKSIPAMCMPLNNGLSYDIFLRFRNIAS